MIWDRRQPLEAGERDRPLREIAARLYEHAPVVTLLLDAELRVFAANQAARSFFEIDPARLPASLVEVTLESRLLDFVNSGQVEAEMQLVHRRSSVQARLASGPAEGEAVLFLADVSELRRLATVRQEFVANLVHELKTPITSLRLTAESLLGDPAPKDRRRFAQRLVQESDLMSKIIDNLRQLGEIEAGAMTSDSSRFDLAELVAESIERLGIERPVRASITRGLTITTDRAKLVQALDNLLDNAAKFSPPDSAIDVEARIDGDEVVISVRDRGPGISPEHWSRVFERFYKVDRARPRESGGFGLGLAITKHLVQVLGGRIWTEAAREGGQIFYIALPSQVLMDA